MADMAYRNNLKWQRINAFKDAGLEAWLDFTSGVDTAARWAGLGFSVEDAFSWRHGFCKPLGATPIDAAKWRDLGYTPEDARSEAGRSYPSPMRTR